MTIGIGVEGPSDKIFWNKLLHKYFTGISFDIRNLKSRQKLIRNTPALLEHFRNLHYRAGFIIIDSDCIIASCKIKSFMHSEFDANTYSEVSKDFQQRDFFICYSIKDIESWYLADHKAISSIIHNLPETFKIDENKIGKGYLKTLIKNNLGENFTYNEIRFAEQIGKHFDPDIAIKNSNSFCFFWTRLKQVIYE